MVQRLARTCFTPKLLARAHVCVFRLFARAGRISWTAIALSSLLHMRIVAIRVFLERVQKESGVNMWHQQLKTAPACRAAEGEWLKQMAYSMSRLSPQAFLAG